MLCRDNKGDVLKKLRGPGAHLLEGPRGVGKSTLLKRAESEMDSVYQIDKVLAVYVNFKSSLLVESTDREVHGNPFLCWIVAKLMDAFYKKSRKLQILSNADIGERYHRLLGVSNISTAQDLENIVRDLRSLSTASDLDKKSGIIDSLKKRGLENFGDVEGVADFVKKIAKDKKIKRVNFLFDEAAHTFDEHQQEIFFQFFKLLHGDVIAVKAAVYPGITSYGGNFEIGQDAIKIAFHSFDENLDPARLQLREHFRELLEKRLSRKQYGEFAKRGDALDLLIILSNGNPRMFLQACSKIIASKEISKRSALAALNEYVAVELVGYHKGLTKRLPRFSSHINLGMDFIKGHLVPELQKKNEGKGDDPSVQTIYSALARFQP